MDKSLLSSEIFEKIESLKTEIKLRSSGRARLLPVTKSFSSEVISAVLDSGVSEVGENYAQELLSKHSELERFDPKWHMLGRLQRNKIKSLAGVITLWQTIDRPELIKTLARLVPEANILIQVNVLQQKGQGGCGISEVERLLTLAVDSGLEVRGLMTIGASGDIKATRNAFETVIRLADQLHLTERSMGMSSDFLLALDCGSTLVRLGTAIFGPRPATKI